MCLKPTVSMYTISTSHPLIPNMQSKVQHCPPEPLHGSAAALIVSSISLNKTVTQSLHFPIPFPHPVSALPPQSVSHLLAQSLHPSLPICTPHFRSLTHVHFLPICHSTRLSCRFSRLPAASFGQPLCLYQGIFYSLKAP